MRSGGRGSAYGGPAGSPAPRIAGNDKIQLRRIETVEDAERECFLGSPTLRIDGRDVDPGAGDRDDYGMKCRLYASEHGMSGTPPDTWILAALAEAKKITRGR